MDDVCFCAMAVDGKNLLGYDRINIQRDVALGI